MDENKNWVNYKKFNPNTELQFLAKSTTGSIVHTFGKYGMYAIIQAGNGKLSSINTTAQVNYLHQNISGGASDKFVSCTVFIANADDTLTYSFGASNSTRASLFFITPRYTNASISTYKVAADSSCTVSLEENTNHVVLGQTGGGGSYSISVTSTTNQYVTDGLTYAAFSTVDETGSGSITARSVSNYGTSYIIDILVS